MLYISGSKIKTKKDRDEDKGESKGVDKGVLQPLQTTSIFIHFSKCLFSITSGRIKNKT